MAKAATWEEEVSNLIKSLTGSRDSVTSPEASIVGGGAAGAFRAQQMVNAKAANMARASGAAAPTAPASSALTTTGGSGGGVTTTGGGINTQGAQPNTSVIKAGQTPFASPNNMRNVTPRSGAGIGSVLSGGAVLNPVAATAGALLASTGEAGRGDYVVNEGDINDIIANPTKYGMVPQPNVTSAPAVSRSAPEQRSPMEQQMVAPATPAVSRSAPRTKKSYGATNGCT